MSYGTVSHFDNGATVRFVREIDAAIERVRRALTSSDDLAAWLSPAQIEHTVGGSVQIDFGEDSRVNGEVRIFEPPNTLEYTWTFTGEPDSILRFELVASGSGTTLVLEHRLLPADQASGYGAGWHAHLDSLDARIAGDPPIDWDERFNSLLGTYTGA